MASGIPAVKTEEYDFEPAVLRFLVSVCMNLEKDERYGEFITKVSDLLNLSENALTHRLSTEITNWIEFKGDVPLPGILPAVYAGVQDYTEEAYAERDKLELIGELTRLEEETLDDILSLMYTPVIRYCSYCKYAGYDKNNYFNHNFRGGHNSQIICPAAIRWQDEMFD